MMRRTMILAVATIAIASSMTMTVPAFADPQEHDHGDHGNDGDHGGDHGGDRGDHHDNGRHNGWDKHGRGDDHRQNDYQTYSQYDYNRPDPRYGDYRAERYYRQGAYPERRLGSGDRIYRGGDGRYYCRRNDGTTGLVIGALGGGVLGNVIAPNGSKTLGAVLGAVGGGLIGRSVDRGNVTCR
jgi:hypothetical protein